MSKSKKNVRAKIRAELRNLNWDIDPRAQTREIRKNRINQIRDLKKREKLLRDQRKRAKFHIGNRRNLRKRWEIEEDLEELGLIE
ncbi:MAG: hypothetical protein ACTSU2_07270 [Promethearchaeota archaeon]